MMTPGTRVIEQAETSADVVAVQGVDRSGTLQDRRCQPIRAMIVPGQKVVAASRPGPASQRPCQRSADSHAEQLCDRCAWLDAEAANGGRLLPVLLMPSINALPHRIDANETLLKCRTEQADARIVRVDAVAQISRVADAIRQALALTG